jgi:DNA replication protein DnaC
MEEQLKTQLKTLNLTYLLNHWNEIQKTAQQQKPSYHRFLTDILTKEYEDQKEKQRIARIKRAHIPEPWVMETFPFDRQPRLKKKMVMELYDSRQFMDKPQNMVFIGPTGCGKTGLATSFLIQALNHGYRGYFIDFLELTSRLLQSVANHSERRIMNHFKSYDLLLIDELGYQHIEKNKAGLFFELMKQRHRAGTTIITSQLGFEEWGKGCLQDAHITNAILDRVTEHCTIFNMKECISLRSKNIIHASSIQ